MKTDAVATLAKVVAVLAVIAALSVFRLPEPPARLIVVAIPAAREEWFAAFSNDERHAVLHDLRNTGIGGKVRTGREEEHTRFWRELFLEQARSTAAASKPVWSPLGGRVAAIAAPRQLLGESGQQPPVLTSGAESGFIGNSAGVVAELEDLTTGKVPPPYDRAAEAVVGAAETLADGQWSPWLPIDGGEGRFQIGRISEDEAWLSPVYKSVDLGAAAPADVLLGDPFVRGVDVDVRARLTSHLVEVERTRVTAVERMLAPSRDVRSVVYFHGLPGALAAMSAPEPLPGGTIQMVRDELDRTLTRVRDASPGRSTILLVGGPSLTRTSGAPAWYLLSDGQGARADLDLEAPSLRALLRYLLGGSLTVEERRAMPPAILARFPVRGGASSAVAAADTAQEQRWSVETLQQLIGSSTGPGVTRF